MRLPLQFRERERKKGKKQNKKEKNVERSSSFFSLPSLPWQSFSLLEGFHARGPQRRIAFGDTRRLEAVEGRAKGKNDSHFPLLTCRRGERRRDRSASKQRQQRAKKPLRQQRRPKRAASRQRPGGRTPRSSGRRRRPRTDAGQKRASFLLRRELRGGA